MEFKGFLVLNTVNGSRKMHYAAKDENIFLYTLNDGLKMDDIKKDANVCVDGVDYLAVVETDTSLITETVEVLKEAENYFGRQFEANETIVLKLAVK